MFNAFWLIIIIPILYTMCAVFISNMLFPGAGSIALVISTEDNTQTSMLSIEDDIKINLGEEVMVDLSVLSTFDKEIEMNIEISCLKNDPLCPSIKENIALKSPRFNLRPKIAIKLPIKIKAVKEWHEKNIGFNISVSYENGTNYASLPLKISVGN